jgi:hypothetical protein
MQDDISDLRPKFFIFKYTNTAEPTFTVMLLDLMFLFIQG